MLYPRKMFPVTKAPLSKAYIVYARSGITDIGDLSSEWPNGSWPITLKLLVLF